MIYTFLLSKNQPRHLREVMLRVCTQRWKKSPMIDIEAIPLYFPKINDLNFGEENRRYGLKMAF